MLRCGTGGGQGLAHAAQAAKICKVSQQTIIRCFDNGRG
jgi:hypothetical protein